MNCTRIIFSPTGGVKRAADILANGMAPGGGVVDLSDATVNFSSCELGSCDVAVIAAPSFGGRVPELCRPLPCAGDQQNRSEACRFFQMYFLYALCGRMPHKGTFREQADGRRSVCGAQESLFRAQGVRIVSVI